MAVTIDLTRLEDAKRQAAVSVGASALGCIIHPYPYPGPLFELLVSVIRELLGRPGGLGKEESEYVTRIIEKGAEAGAEEIHIVVNRETALGLDLKIGTILKKGRPLNLTFGLRGDTTYEIKVKYGTRNDRGETA